jgi:hypothetical protein
LHLFVKQPCCNNISCRICEDLCVLLVRDLASYHFIPIPTIPCLLQSPSEYSCRLLRGEVINCLRQFKNSIIFARCYGRHPKAIHLDTVILITFSPLIIIYNTQLLCHMHCVGICCCERHSGKEVLSKGIDKQVCALALALASTHCDFASAGLNDPGIPHLLDVQ